MQKHRLGNAYPMTAVIVNYCYLIALFQNPGEWAQFFRCSWLIGHLAISIYNP